MWCQKLVIILPTLMVIIEGIPLKVSKPKAITPENIEGLKYLLKNTNLRTQTPLFRPPLVQDPNNYDETTVNSPKAPLQSHSDYSIPTEEELNKNYDDPAMMHLQNMQPPALTNEPNYYAAEKPRKGGKKYLPHEKLINLKKVAVPSKLENPSKIKNVEYPFEDVYFYDMGEQYFMPTNQRDIPYYGDYSYEQPETAGTVAVKKSPDLNIGETETNAKRKLDANEDRIEFQMHGHAGPKSYKFGYDTGKGKNRQFRFEERDNDGKLKGHYGYMDKKGKVHIIKYTSSPEEGFKAEKAS